MEQEITVEVNASYEELDKKIKEKGFKIVDEYTINDTYMLNNSIDITNLSNREILSKCILVRDISPYTKKLTYKYKEFDSNGDIIDQHKVDCPVEDIEKAIKFMEAINYKKIFNLKDEITVYSNDLVELAVQQVDNHIYIEIEAKYKDKVYTVDEMKNMLIDYDLPYDKNDYFVKKAEIKLKEMKKYE